MKRWGKRLLPLLAVLMLVGGAYAGWRYGHPAPPPARDYLPPARQAPGALRVRFFGATTLLLDDGANAVMIDSLLTRPGMRDVLFREIASDPGTVERVLRGAGVRRVDLLLVSHSHYDHALDVNAVVRRTGALLVGSSSTRQIAFGGDVAREGVRIVEGGERLDAGAFRVTVFRSLHSPGDRIPGAIAAPLHQPAKTGAFKEGGTFAFLIEHKGMRALVHASAGAAPGMYRGMKADAVFLAVGGLGALPDGYARRYWHEVVETTGAKLVVPIHWDDFLRPLDQPQLPMRRFMDDFPAAMRRLAPLAARQRVAIRYMPVLQPVDVAAAVRAAQEH